MRSIGCILIIFTALLILSSSQFVMAQFPSDYSVGLRVGDWVKYTGSVPGQNFEWIKVSISSVSGTSVTVSVTYKVVGQAASDISSSGDVATGLGNIFPFIIPANLASGDTVPTPSYYSSLTISGVTTRSYAGASRSVVFIGGYSMPGAGTGTLYWDRKTGVLVEISIVSEGISYSLKATETNMWSSSPIDWIMSNILWIILVLIGLVVVAVVALIFLKARKAQRVPVPVGQVDAGLQFKYCIKCGSSMPLEATYCPKCGEKQLES